MFVAQRPSAMLGATRDGAGKRTYHELGAKVQLSQCRSLRTPRIPKSNLNFHVIKKVCVHVCVLSRFSHVQHFATLWMVARQSPLPMGVVQARILEWVVMPFSRGSSAPRDPTQVSYVSCIAGGFFTSEPPGKPIKKVQLKYIEDIGYII